MIRLPVVEILNKGHPKYVDSEMVIILVSKTKVLGSSPSRRATYSLLAQLVCESLEHHTFNMGVVGSNPTGGTSSSVEIQLR